MIGNTRIGIFDKLRDIYSLCRCCWNVTTYICKVHNMTIDSLTCFRHGIGEQFFIIVLNTSSETLEKLRDTLLHINRKFTMWKLKSIFSRIFLSNYWWQKSDIWSQASYRYPISWEACFDPSDSYFLFAEERGYNKWALAHSSSYLYEACDQISDSCHQQLLRKMRRKISWTDGRTEVKQYTPLPLRGAKFIVFIFIYNSANKDSLQNIYYFISKILQMCRSISGKYSSDWHTIYIYLNKIQHQKKEMTRMSPPWILRRLANVSPFFSSLSNKLRITNYCLRIWILIWIFCFRFERRSTYIMYEKQ
jgi:hypothetical protein